MITRRHFCTILLAAPAVAKAEIGNSDFAFENDPNIDLVENGLMEFRDGKLTRINVSLPARMQEYLVPGFSIAVINDYKIAWTKGYGVLEQGIPRRVTTDSLFASGSISKAAAFGLHSYLLLRPSWHTLARDNCSPQIAWRTVVLMG